MPALSAWARWCYGTPANLWFGNHDPIKSSQGVQQGDPLGPLFFALALRVLTASMADKFPGLLLHAWYLDDGTIIATRDVIADVITYLKGPEVCGIGLHIILPKCEVWWPSGDPLVPEIDSAVPRGNQTGTEVLRIPVGSDVYVAQRLRKRVTDMKGIIWEAFFD